MSWRSLSLIVILLNFIVSSTTFSSAPLHVGLSDNWSIQTLEIQESNQYLDRSWKDLGTGQANLSEAAPQQAIYEKEFPLDSEFMNSGQFYLILPPLWGSKSVYLNGSLISHSELGSRSPEHIFSSQILNINKQFMKEENKLKIVVQSLNSIGGFKDRKAFITSSGQEVTSVKIKNFFVNDIHWMFIAFSISIALICFSLSRSKPEFPLRYLALGVASFGIIPHHLLATEFYSLLSLSQESAFRFHLTCQTLVWPCYLVFFLMLDQRYATKTEKVFRQKLFLIGIFSLYSFVIFGALFLEFPFFLNIVSPILALSVIFAFALVLKMPKQSPFFWLFLGSSLLNSIFYCNRKSERVTFILATRLSQCKSSSTE